jgi:hypothetical protein
MSKCIILRTNDLIDEGKKCLKIMLFLSIQSIQQLALLTTSTNILSFKGMFGWARNSRIDDVLRIKITVVYPNTNLLFRNSENNCYSAIMW